MNAIRIKPRLRGVSHQAAFFAAAGAGTVLVAVAPGVTATLACAIYAGCLTFLFGISALYHRPDWPPAARRFLRRLDHAAIYLLIAGTYTPLCVLSLAGVGGLELFGWVWLAATFGIVKSIAWPGAPKIVSAAVYLLLGWAIVFYLPEIVGALATADLVLIAAGGLLYTVGAIVYALRSPDPLPSVFGYHEIFHALVVGASICHFVAIGRVSLTA